MALDLAKYLALKPQIDADVLLAVQAVKDAESARNTSVGVYDSAVNTLNNLQAVEKMLVGLMPVSPPPVNPAVVPVIIPIQPAP